MAERQVTVDNVRHTLSPTFFVIATQNPVEHHGTYSLPEAQLDRFAMKLSIGYPERDDELETAGRCRRRPNGRPCDERVLQEGQLGACRNTLPEISRQPERPRLSGRSRRATRSHPQVTLGLSPRGLLIWQRVAQAWAFLRQRPFVTPDDVQQVAQSCARRPPWLASGVDGSSAFKQIVAIRPRPGLMTWRQ